MKIVSSLLFSLICVNAWAVPRLPDLFFTYSSVFESSCPRYSAKRISEEQRELASQFPERAQLLWKRDLHSFFAKLEEIFPGSGFRRKEYTATVTLCESFGSFSSPLTLNLFYMSQNMLEHPDSDAYEIKFADLLFHELLHTWQSDNFDVSELYYLKKYQEEVPVVRNHIYIVALQEFVYRSLHLKKLVGFMKKDWKIKPIDYQRAWEIVEEEGYQKFIEDLKLHQKVLFVE